MISSLVLKLPPELEKHADVIEFDLPGDDQTERFSTAFTITCAGAAGRAGRRSLADRNRLIGALKGLTKTEIEAVIAKSIEFTTASTTTPR